jgi:uncharacterized phage protein gp47/JayE
MAVPTRDELIAQVRNDLSAEGVAQVWIRRTFEAALAVVLGGLLWSWYEWIDGKNGLAKQFHPATATGIPLRLWCAIYGITARGEGTAVGTAVLDGTPSAVLDAGSFLIGPEGQEYTLDAAATLEGDGAGSAFPNITAAGSGGAYNLPVGTPLIVASPTSGISGAASVGLTGITGGQPAEMDDALRARLLERIARPGEVGHERDFVRWAREASTSVARVWVYPRGRLGTQAGEVLVLIGVAGSYPIPADSLVTAVANYLATKRPAGAHVSTEKPAGHAVPLSLHAPTATTTGKALIATLLAAYYATLDPGEIAANIYLAAAAAQSGLAVTFMSVDGGAGNADAVPATNKTLLYPGTISWV